MMYKKGIIQKLRNSKTFKGACVLMAMNLLAEIVAPMQSLALTGGASQPEFSKFTPIGTSDMVDLSSGDMKYNIPLMDVGGYPLNIAYSAGGSGDEEGAWTGFGWTLSAGQIVNNVRGLPDDFKGDALQYEDYVKPNLSINGSFRFTPNVFGVDADGNKIKPADVGAQNDAGGPMSYGVTVGYNNYTGLDIKLSASAQMGAVGISAESGPDGLSISPEVNFSIRNKQKKDRDINLGGKIGCSFNSRQGVSNLSVNMTRKISQMTVNSDGKREVEKNKKETGLTSVGSTIGFTDPVYTPTIRNGMKTESFSLNVALGSEFFGGEGQGEITAYGTIQALAEKNRSIKGYGYAYSDYSYLETDNGKATMDINREKESPVSKNMTNLPVTNYTYDIHSVQGQGVGGMYRPYRNQVGYVTDCYAWDVSTSAELGAEFGVGNLAHGGFDLGVTVVDGHSGMWQSPVANYFKLAYNTAADYEQIHYKNVGDLSVDRNFTSAETAIANSQLFSRIGGYSAVNIPVVGIKFFRNLTNKYQPSWGSDGNAIALTSKIYRDRRQVRNQMIYNIKNSELQSGIGYGPVRYGQQTLPAEAKGHHIGEVQIMRNDGARYIYGLPAYNTVKKEVTFALKGTPDKVDCNKGLVDYSDYAGAISSGNFEALPNDKYFNRVTTPGYVHTHLLTSVLSTDYQDVDNNGPSMNDLGSYTHITYHKNPVYNAGTQTVSSSNNLYKWRTPLEANKANYNEGLKTDAQDDQGNYIYGEKFQYYVDKIETKTHVAVFHISPRRDAHGVSGEHGGIATSQESFKLDRISLYSVADYYTSGGAINTAAVPIKEVHFVYSYDLCKGVLNNLPGPLTANELHNNGGKLTLKKMYFTYRDSKMGKYTDYEFDYNESDPLQNPDYNLKGYDSWGNYKPNLGDCSNMAAITAMEYPYTGQNKLEQDQYAAVWNLKKITLPSGGTIKIEYESDDYGYVQDKKAMRMYTIAGVGKMQNGSTEMNSNPTDVLYNIGLLPDHKRYLYIEVPENNPSTSLPYIRSRYFSGLKKNMIQFRFMLNMTKYGSDATSTSAVNEAKYDYVSGYAQLDLDGHWPEIFEYSGKYYLSVPVKLMRKEGGLIQTPAEDRNPIAKAGWSFGRKYLGRDVYSTYDNGDPNIDSPEGQVQDIAEDLMFVSQTISNLWEVFVGPNGKLEGKGIGRRFIKHKSFIRLDDPSGKKLGGGCRVKSVQMNDIWEKMNNETEGTVGGYRTMNYGQSYRYTLEESEKSSGVATYEPVGNKENPFVQPVFSTIEHVLAPDDVNYVEEPFGECYFPSPSVTYSRVRVENLSSDSEALPAGKQVKHLHRTGHVVSEFYTTKDFPTLVSQTKLDAKNDDTGPLGSLLKLYSTKQFTGSQGYMVHLNDMNGKEKAQWVYAAGQEAPISGVEYKYATEEITPSAGITAAMNLNGTQTRLNNKVTVIYPDGKIKENTIGVEYDIVNDFRESQVESTMGGGKYNGAGFMLAAFPGFVPMVLPKFSRSKEQFRSVVTTKVINTFGILEETRAHEDGAVVSTRNLAWDAMTGEVLVTQTVDEYNDNYYTMNYPAHWVYQGMGAASLNIGFKGTAVPVGLGINTLSGSAQASGYLVDGDEIVYGSSNQKGWIYNVQGDQFKIMDASGSDVQLGANATFTIVRSGRRNLQSAGIMNVTLMQNPLLNPLNGQALTAINHSYLSSQTWDNYRIINAGAVDYSDNWPGLCECGVVGSGIHNPYLTNEKGVWRTKSSRTYLTGRNYQTYTTGRREGFFTAFSPFYKLSNGGHWFKDYTNWTFVSEVSLFSPYGFELENKDALNRYSGAQYGYNFKFPMAVGANTKYAEIGFDGFEDYGFNACTENLHFSFREFLSTDAVLQESVSHTGKNSIQVAGGKQAVMHKKINCSPNNQ